MAVRGEDGLVGVRHTLANVDEERADLFGNGETDRVGQVDRVGAGGNRLFDDAAQEIAVRPRRVLRRKLDVVRVIARGAHGIDDGGEAGLARNTQLTLEVKIRRRQKCVNALALCRLQRSRRFFDIRFALIAAALARPQQMSRRG